MSEPEVTSVRLSMTKLALRQLAEETTATWRMLNMVTPCQNKKHEMARQKLLIRLQKDIADYDRALLKLGIDHLWVEDRV